MQDLFSDTNQLEKIALPDADVCYMSALNLGASPAVLLKALVAEVPWRLEHVTVWGKTYPQPRLIAWFGDAGQKYSYSGIRLEPLPWSDTLNALKQRVESAADSTFNSVLLNYYRDNNDSMGFHSDDEPELGPKPVIASLSVGERRVFVMKHKFRKELKPAKLPLESGSLLIMKGETQRFWKHAIEKERTVCGARVNLTFRRILNVKRKAA